jgi:hypothetical protein
MVGAEQNTTDQIADHDVYAQGEFKDDQLQEHRHKSTSRQSYASGSANYAMYGATTGANENGIYDVYNARVGTTTHGKQKAVYVYIKAVDGVDISDEDTFLVTVKNFVDERVTRAESYSTEEQWTGGTWIDGKPIYRKCKTQQTYSGGGTNNIIDLELNGIIDSLVSLRTITKQSNGEQMGDYCFSSTTLQNCYLKTNGTVQYRAGSSYSYGQTTVIIEYTKTTD